MNKRIKELIKELTAQAGFDPSAIERLGIMPNAERFAELIVRECLSQIHVADVGDLKAKSYYLDKVAEHIEKHFGVE